jgi:hypothetical protein
VVQLGLLPIHDCAVGSWYLGPFRGASDTVLPLVDTGGGAMWLNIAQFALMEAHRSSEECAGADRASPRRPPAGRSRSGVDDDYCADLYSLLPKVCQRPTLDAVRHRQRPQEDCKIVREHEELLPHGIGGERTARQPRPLRYLLTFFDPLLGGAVPIVECDDALGRGATSRSRQGQRAESPPQQNQRLR